MDNKLNGKVALVTGGSRGIGKEICKALASYGAYVFINYSSSPDKAKETLQACGDNGELLGFNVADSESVDKAIDLIKEKKGQLDILVNNAGISKNGLSVRFSDQDWKQVIDVNLTGAFYCSRAAIKIMMKAKSGTIINISSIVAEMGNPGQAAYVASKAGLIGLTKSLAKEFASRNITVNAITPGFIETDMTTELDQKTKEQYLANIALGRFGKPEEVASLVAFLASSNANYITGQVIGLNGGLYM